jgi:hypothetical protein
MLRIIIIIASCMVVNLGNAIKNTILSDERVARVS